MSWSEQYQRLAKGLNESDKQQALLHCQGDSANALAQCLLNLSYLEQPSAYLSSASHLWPPTQYAAPIVTAASIGQLVIWAARQTSLMLCSPVVLSSEHHYDVYFADSEGFFYRNGQGQRIQQVAIETWLSAFTHCVGWLGGDVRTMQVLLPWLSADALPQYLRAWHLKVAKGDSFAVLRIPKQTWLAPLPRGQHGEIPYEPSLLYRLRQQIFAHHDLAESARALAMSPATLKRQLNSKNTSFRKQQHFVHAILYHHGEQFLGLSKQALMQKFSIYDASTLKRAHRRWLTSLAM